MPSYVARPDLESLLEAMARQTGDPRAGIFGPESMTWRVSREAALFLGAGRAALLQLAHPWVAAAILEHSRVLGDPIARFHNTFRIVFTVIFGSREQAFAAARHLHTLHTGIRGDLPEAVGSWPAGAPYEANEVSALRWVYATLIDTAVLAYTTVLPLEETEREQYYQESKRMAALFGIPPEALPADWAGFAAYNQEMAASDTLGVSAAARRLGGAILSGAGSWIHPPHWYRALTVEWLPPRLREEFGLRRTMSDTRSAARARRWLPRAWRALPPPVRFVGPYQEARARLEAARVRPWTRWSNRFWIGQSALPFSNAGHGLPQR